MTSRKALGDLRFNVSMSQDIDYKEANNECDIIEKDLDKLSKLEDIEEELGVDLIKLLTARTIFTIYNDDRIFYHIDIEDGGVYTSEYDADDKFYPFSDYGRTWAFTREELEK